MECCNFSGPAPRKPDFHNAGLDSFTLPGLRRLELHNGEFSTLSPFPARSSCALEHLQLPLHGDQTDLEACFQAVPSLQSLTIDVPYDVELTSFTQVLDTDPPLLPRLRTLTISAAYNQFDYLAFIQFLQARNDHPGDVARVMFAQLNVYGDDHDRPYKEDWLPSSVIFEFDKLIAQGMTLRATYNGDVYDEQVWPGENIGKSDPRSKLKPADSPTFRPLRDLPLVEFVV
ncbi:hypothetical protein B0H19DRAFT_1334459 [Mycena capillaripes]|nr:hypothetical protein B0H19DRAFT_1334459 [Mycena capillaripes]